MTFSNLKGIIVLPSLHVYTFAIGVILKNTEIVGKWTTENVLDSCQRRFLLNFVCSIQCIKAYLYSCKKPSNAHLQGRLTIPFSHYTDMFRSLLCNAGVINKIEAVKHFVACAFVGFYECEWFLLFRYLLSRCLAAVLTNLVFKGN